MPVRERWFKAGRDLVLLAAVALCFRQFVAVAFDEAYARLQGVPATVFYQLLLVLVAVTVLLMIQVVGLILVTARLTLPAAVAGHWPRLLGSMMGLAALAGQLLTSAGLTLSYGPNLPSGPTIILLASALYLASPLVAGSGPSCACAGR